MCLVSWWRRLSAPGWQGGGGRRTGGALTDDNAAGRDAGTVSQGGGERFQRHLQLAKHVQIRLGGPAEGSEVVTDDDGVDPTDHALLGAEITEGDLAPAGVPQDRVRQGEPESGDGTKRFAGVDDGIVAERRPRPGVKEVQRNLVRPELGELGRKLGSLGDGLTEADDPAAADFHTGFLHHLQ